MLLAMTLASEASPWTSRRRRRAETENLIEDVSSQNLPSYVLDVGEPFHPADHTISPPTKFTSNGKKFSVFAPPHGNSFPFGGVFWTVVD